ncbi:hypothetical protein AAG906_015002 [Vitis piasezkii]
MATSSPSILNTNDSHNTLININVVAQTPLKLTSTNYLSWKLQFHTLFIGYDLLGYINGSKPCPSATLTQNDTTRSNLAHTIWIRQDQLILNAIIGSISHTIIPFIAQAKTTREAWTILATTYANQLKLITKGSDGVTSFLQSIKAKTDELVLFGAPLDVEDLTDKILDGLASVITPKPDPLQFPATANPTSKNPTPWRSPAPSGTNNHTWRPSNSHQNRYPSTQTSGQPTPQGNHPSQPYLGYCQICRIQGYTAKWCPSFQLVPVNTSTSLFALNKLFATPWKPRAHYASNTPSYTSSDLHNLSMHTLYNGSDDIMIGDGSGLSITHIDSSFLHTPHNTFKLNNVLCVPTMKKNLISISQIFTSNNVSIEFLPTAFLVKDIHTGATFLKDNIKDGVYEWLSAYYCLDPSTSKIYVSMHVRFAEFVFLFRHLSAPSSCPPSDFITTWIPPPLRIPNLPLVPPLNPSSAMDAQQQSSNDASPPPDLPATSLPPPSREPSHTNNPHYPSPHISPPEP